MAIAPTGAIYKSLIFDGEDSRNYGVYITGEAAYNAPGRDVEMVEIPGRNGSFALDKGRFQNIEVSYPAGIFADNEADFASAVSDFRNYLCSRKGYCRLADEYNPEEYRMAIYKGGLEVSPAQLKAGEFNIVFDCKPQRYLISGETELTLESGDTLTNPTLFDASPLIAVEGYGTIGFNGYEIELNNEVMGDISILVGKSFSGFTFGTFESGTLNAGDTISVNIGSLALGAIIKMNAHTTPTTSGAVSDSNGNFSTSVVQCFNNVVGDPDAVYVRILSACQPITFTAGTNATVTNTAEVVVDTQGNKGVWTETVRYQILSDGNHRISIEIDVSGATGSNVVSYGAFGDTSYINGVTAYSTVSILGDPTYINCDFGEAYMIKGGSVISLNAYIDLGSGLPKLASGANEITYDNTVTDLKITPRWWKV